MIIPVDLLIKNQGNMYELTCAVIKRAVQLNITSGTELDAFRGKIVSLALKEILTKKVEYQLEAKLR